MKFINIYYNFLAFQNNIIINFLLIVNIIFPKRIKKNLIYYKKKGDNYYNYLSLSIKDNIDNKYNYNIKIELYDKYKKYINLYYNFLIFKNNI